METLPLMIFALVGFAFIASVSSEPFIEAQDASMENAPEANEKRWHNGWSCSNRRCYSQGNCPHGQFCYYYRCCQRNSQRPCSHHAHCPNGWYCDYRARVCKVGERRCSHSYHCSRYQVCVNGKCQKRECYYHNQCKQGHYCASGICKPKPGYCTSQSSCTASQCCAKYYPQQVGGQCKDRKKPGAWCPVKPDGYHCGCTEGFECRRYYNHYYWGKCTAKPCSSDNSCQKTHCCSGRQCKPRKKANDFCPLKGADIYHCGCIEGYQCKPAGVGNYWGKCEQIVPPTEEPGSGLGEIVS